MQCLRRCWCCKAGFFLFLSFMNEPLTEYNGRNRGWACNITMQILFGDPVLQWVQWPSDWKPVDKDARQTFLCKAQHVFSFVIVAMGFHSSSYHIKHATSSASAGARCKYLEPNMREWQRSVKHLHNPSTKRQDYLPGGGQEQSKSRPPIAGNQPRWYN